MPLIRQTLNRWHLGHTLVSLIPKAQLASARTFSESKAQEAKKVMKPPRWQKGKFEAEAQSEFQFGDGENLSEMNFQ